MSLYNDYNPEPTWGETFRKFWPKTDSELGARHALKLASFAYNTMIALIIVYGFLREEVGFWPIVDVCLLAAVSFGVHKGSLVIALFGVAYFIFSHLITLYSEPTGVVFLMVATLLFVGALNGVRGAIALRRIQTRAAPRRGEEEVTGRVE